MYSEHVGWIFSTKATILISLRSIRASCYSTVFAKLWPPKLLQCCCWVRVNVLLVVGIILIIYARSRSIQEIAPGRQATALQPCLAVETWMVPPLSWFFDETWFSMTVTLIHYRETTSAHGPNLVVAPQAILSVYFEADWPEALIMELIMALAKASAWADNIQTYFAQHRKYPSLCTHQSQELEFLLRASATADVQWRHGLVPERWMTNSEYRYYHR